MACQKVRAELFSAGVS
jgi:hypothetical protein